LSMIKCMYLTIDNRHNVRIVNTVSLNLSIVVLFDNFSTDIMFTVECLGT
jgi:hypothetical protein